LKPGIFTDDVFRKTIDLAAALEVPTVVTFSGCPGAGPRDESPNWIIAPWPPEYLDALAWQWGTKLIPYWQKAAGYATEHGLKIALEAHPGFCVYNPETLLRLRAACGPSIGINLDPSHLFWQGIDIPSPSTPFGKLSSMCMRRISLSIIPNYVKMACLMARATSGCRSGLGYFAAWDGDMESWSGSRSCHRYVWLDMTTS